jgi:hypothetical protein
MAVSRKPAIAAVAHPYSISWACRSIGARSVAGTCRNIDAATAAANDGPYPREQEESAKAVREQCGPGVLAAALQCGMIGY